MKFEKLFKRNIFYDYKVKVREIMKTELFFNEDSDINISHEIHANTKSLKKNDLKYLIIKNIDTRMYGLKEIYEMMDSVLTQKRKIIKIFFFQTISKSIDKGSYFEQSFQKNFDNKTKFLSDANDRFLYLVCDSYKTAKILYLFFNNRNIGASGLVMDVRMTNSLDHSSYEITDSFQKKHEIENRGEFYKVNSIKNFENGNSKNSTRKDLHVSRIYSGKNFLVKPCRAFSNIFPNIFINKYSNEKLVVRNFIQFKNQSLFKNGIKKNFPCYTN
jgi:hypothetical protein